MLRHLDRVVIAQCVLASVVVAGALTSDAWGQARRGGGPAMHGAPAMHGGGAPRMAAPAPRMTAPAPRFSAARMAAPRIPPPSRNFAASHAPRFAVQRRPEMATRGRAAVPRLAATPRFAAQRRAEMTRERATQRFANRPSSGPAGERARQGQPPQEQQLSNAPKGQTTGLNRRNQALIPQGALSDKNLSVRNPGARDGARFAENRRDPILRNPVFAGQPSGNNPSAGTFRGRFAQSAWARDHRHRHLGIVLGFAGLTFWPYAYDDFIDYTYAPYAYDTFWPYAFDDVYAGIYGGFAPEYNAPEDAYAYAGSPASANAYSRGGTVATSGGNERICSGQAQGLTDFSIQKIAQQIQPDEQQQALLNDLKAATGKAVDILQAACPTELPSTPTGRLATMRARVNAMLQAVETVGPALEKFYQSLNDEQRERFNAADEGQQAAQTQADVGLCNSENRTQIRLPVDRIQRTLHLEGDQGDALKALDDATAKSAEILQEKCQPTQTLTPTGRLAAMRDRLIAMQTALETTQTALNKFYGSLSDEQKAQFDRFNARSSS
jgi:hypothetical protein